MRKDIQDIGKTIVDSIDKTIKVSRVELPDNRTMKMFVCEMKWLKVGGTILDNQDRDSEVTEIGDGYIVIYKGSVFTWDSPYFTIVKDLHYFPGTPMAVNNEWNVFKANEKEKAPFVWMNEMRDEEEYFPFTNSQIERNSPLEVFFLDITDYEKFTTKDHHDIVIKGLNAWVDSFIDAIRKNVRDFDYRKIESIKIKNFSLFGTETKNGIDQWLFDSNLCAVRVRLTLPIRKGAKCLC